MMKQARYVKAATAIAVLFIATGCTSTPTASPVASDSPSPAASPTPIAELLCTLPVDRGLGALFGIPSNPKALPPDDPSSDVKLPDGEPRVGLSYDWALKRWLPVPYSWVAADGEHYAYTDAQSRIHLLTVTGGVDQILASGATWGIYSYGAGGIYAGQQDLTKQPSLRGLWRISPTGGAPEQLTSQGSWPVIGAEAAWSVASSPQSRVSADGYGTVLSRFDLLSREVSAWYSSTGGDFRVATVDTNVRPVLVSRSSQGGSSTISVVRSLGTAQTIGSGTAISDVMADSHGVWYVDNLTLSIYLVQSTGPQSMGQYGYSGTIKFAGPCH
jgi:hypothetical protein